MKKERGSGKGKLEGEGKVLKFVLVYVSPGSLPLLTLRLRARVRKVQCSRRSALSS